MDIHANAVTMHESLEVVPVIHKINDRESDPETGANLTDAAPRQEIPLASNSRMELYRMEFSVSKMAAMLIRLRKLRETKSVAERRRLGILPKWVTRGTCN